MTDPGDFDADLVALLAEARREVAQLALRNRYLDWKLESIYATRSWRLAAAVRGLVRHPRRLSRFPGQVLRAFSNKPRGRPPLRIDEASPARCPLPEGPLPEGPAARSVLSGVTAAVVVTDELARRLAYEWEQVRLDATTWRTSLHTGRPDLLLVGTWWDELPAVLDAYREARIPCLLWTNGIEDDALVGLANRFDHIFAATQEQTRRYVEVVGPAKVSALPPAVQPRIHNLVDNLVDLVTVHPPRIADVAWIGTIETKQLPGASYGRFGDNGIGKAGMAHRGYKVALTDGNEWAELRHVLEFAASGVPIIAVEGDDGVRGRVARALGAGVVAVPRRDVSARLVNLLGNAQLRDRTAHRAARAVLAEHTYRHRVDEIIRRAGIPPVDRTIPVTVLMPTRRPDQIERAIEQVAAQHHRPLQLVLVLHGSEFDVGLVRKQALTAGIDDVVVLEADRWTSLGGCLNRGIEVADGRYLAKMDDDDLYGRHHLTDLVAAFTYTSAGVVGRGAHYAHFLDSGATILRNPGAEHQYTRHVHGGTIVATAEVMRSIRFTDRSVGEDTAFLAECTARGIPIYSADRFSFVWLRRADTAQHSWQRDEAELLRKGRLEFYGRPDQHVLI